MLMLVSIEIYVDSSYRDHPAVPIQAPTSSRDAQKALTACAGVEINVLRFSPAHPEPTKSSLRLPVALAALSSSSGHKYGDFVRFNRTPASAQRELAWCTLAWGFCLR